MNRNGTHGLDQQHVDWNLELRRIERQFDGLPPEPSQSVVKARKEAERRERAELDARIARIGSAARLALVGVLTGALYWWPYGSRCGPELAALLGAMGMVAVGGLWTAAHAWRHRIATSHVLSIALLIAGLALVAAQVLPRMGYVTVAGIKGGAWRCEASASPVFAAS